MGYPKRHKCPGCGYEGFMEKALPLPVHANHVRKQVRNLRTIRKQHGLSQQQLADLAGIHRNTVARIERGEQWANRPTQQRLVEVVRRLKARSS
jgi:DNA-binding XRE family transcriptional regulator